MDHDRRVTQGEPGRRSRDRSRTTRLGALVAALAAVVLMAAACSSSPSTPGVASAGTTTTTSGSGSSTHNPKASALAFAHCMQTHGVPNFPDPSATGHTIIQGGPNSGLNPQSSAFQKAQQHCQKYSPEGNLTPSQKTQQRTRLLEFAKCMRAHGVTDFPDPASTGRLSIKAGSGSNLNPRSPQFQTAQNACQHYLPGGKAPSPPKSGGSGQTSGGGNLFLGAIAGVPW